MNIIFYRYNSIYEPDMIDAFTRSGLNVIEITEEMTDKDISNARRIELLEAYISKYEPLFVYGINYYPAIAEVCRILNVPYMDALDKRVVSEIKEAAGDDFPVFKKGVAESDNYVVSHRYIGSHIAVTERERTLSLLSKFFHVDLYTRSDVSSLANTTEVITDSNSRGYVPELDAINSTYTTGSITDKDKSTNKQAADRLSPSGLHVHPGVNTLTEMPKVFNLSRINLNITMRPIETGLPLRCFDILGCGGFLMTNYQPELEDMFIIGEDLESYSSPEELVDKCSYYLTHEDERAVIARNGYEKVKANHTHIHRLKEMLKTVV